MVKKNLHIINKFSLELSKNSKKDVHKVQSQSVAILKEKLIPEIEKIFNKYDTGKTIRIDKLEIDLGDINLKHLESQVLQQIKAQTTLQLDSFFEKKKIKEIELSLKETFQYFLKKGTLPWWKNKISIEEFEESIVEEIQSNKWNIEDILKPFDQSNIERLVFQFSDDFFIKVLKHQKIEGDFISSLDQLQKELEKHFPKRLVRNQIWFSSIPEIFSSDFNSKESARIIFSKVIKILSKQNSQSENTIINNILKTQKLNNKLRLILKELQKIDRQASKIKNSNKLRPSIKYKRANTKGSNNPHYINNAGLILLHPFIVNLFKHLKYTKDKKFIDEYHQHQAVLVLQYLCNEKIINPEYDLILNKILCGIHPDTPIENTLIINKEIKTQCQKLLTASIKHWPVIKTTSPNALQSTFLNREGKLHQKENDDWKLFIENKTVDILVSKIPWSISMIKLPWMKNILWVDWA